MTAESTFRRQLINQLEGGNAHVSLEKAVDGLTLEQVGQTVNKLPHTIWELTEHIRIAQRDIVEFSTSTDYKALEWPDDYWPSDNNPGNQQAWDEAVEAIRQDRETMIDVIKDEENNLLVPIPHGDGQTLFREAMLIADHNSYHIGQIVQLRRLLGCW